MPRRELVSSRCRTSNLALVGGPIGNQNGFLATSESVNFFYSPINAAFATEKANRFKDMQFYEEATTQDMKVSITSFVCLFGTGVREEGLNRSKNYSNPDLRRFHRRRKW